MFTKKKKKKKEKEIDDCDQHLSYVALIDNY